jgi:glutamate synthase domain-containing protein 3
MAINYYELIPIFISIIAIITAIILGIVNYIRSKKFKKKSEENGKTILNLIKEKNTMKDHIVEKLDLLKEREEEQQALLLEMIEKHYKESEKEKKEDLMNWLNYRASIWQEKIEDRISERFARLQSEISDLSKRVFKIEAKLEKEKK